MPCHFHPLQALQRLQCCLGYMASCCQSCHTPVTVVSQNILSDTCGGHREHLPGLQVYRKWCATMLGLLPCDLHPLPSSAMPPVLLCCSDGCYNSCHVPEITSHRAVFVAHVSSKVSTHRITSLHRVASGICNNTGQVLAGLVPCRAFDAALAAATPLQEVVHA